MCCPFSAFRRLPGSKAQLVEGSWSSYRYKHERERVQLLWLDDNVSRDYELKTTKTDEQTQQLPHDFFVLTQIVALFVTQRFVSDLGNKSTHVFDIHYSPQQLHALSPLCP